jgi:chaperonin cofactor prefoldin
MDTFFVDDVDNIFIPQNVEGFRSEIRSLQSKLSEVSTSSIQQGQRLREVRKAKREIDQENIDLKAKLKSAQVCSQFHMYLYT